MEDDESRYFQESKESPAGLMTQELRLLYQKTCIPVVVGNCPTLLARIGEAPSLDVYPDPRVDVLIAAFRDIFVNARKNALNSPYASTDYVQAIGVAAYGELCGFHVKDDFKKKFTSTNGYAEFLRKELQAGKGADLKVRKMRAAVWLESPGGGVRTGERHLDDSIQAFLEVFVRHFFVQPAKMSPTARAVRGINKSRQVVEDLHARISDLFFYDSWTRYA